jgi:hypothetical protein
MKTKTIYVTDANGYAFGLADWLMEKSAWFMATPLPFGVWEFEIKLDVWFHMAEEAEKFEVEESPARWDPKDE